MSKSTLIDMTKLNIFIFRRSTHRSLRQLGVGYIRVCVKLLRKSSPVLPFLYFAVVNTNYLQCCHLKTECDIFASCVGKTEKSF